MYEVVHERDSVCVWDYVDASVHVVVNPNENANAPVDDLVDLYLTVDARRPGRYRATDTPAAGGVFGGGGASRVSVTWRGAPPPEDTVRVTLVPVLPPSR